jgi:hypothetical protein
MRLSFARSDQVPNRHRESVSEGRISSAVEQRFCKPKVGGSIPSSGTISPPGSQIRGRVYRTGAKNNWRFNMVNQMLAFPRQNGLAALTNLARLAGVKPLTNLKCSRIVLQCERLPQQGCKE